MGKAAEGKRQSKTPGSLGKTIAKYSTSRDGVKYIISRDGVVMTTAESVLSTSRGREQMDAIERIREAMVRARLHASEGRQEPKVKSPRRAGKAA